MVINFKENKSTDFNKIAEHPLQSWEWGEFRKATGNKVVRVGIQKNSKLSAAAQLTIHKIPFTRYAIGALIKGPEPTKELITSLKELAKKENLLFIKMEPNVVRKVNAGNKTDDKTSSRRPPPTNHFSKVIKLLKNSGAVPGKTLFTPTTFWIDLTPSEDALLSSFHPKTRYNIRLAIKKGVEVVEDNSDNAFERYLELTRETVERQGFYAHTEKYHRLMWQYLNRNLVAKNKKPIARLLTARYKNKIITAWIVFVWKDFLYYPYGASTEKYKEVMANNLIMWEAIKYGKRLGLKTFDLWGREEGKGFTKFKEGYNPKVVEFLGTWDLVTSTFYSLYLQAEKLRWQFLRARSHFTFTKPSF